MNTTLGITSKTREAHIVELANAVRATVIDPHTSRAREVCCDATEKIVRQLAGFGVIAESVSGHVLAPGVLLRHHWTRVGNQIVDVTIDQLGEQYPAVYIGNQPDTYHPDAEWQDPELVRLMLIQVFPEFAINHPGKPRASAR